MPIDNFSEVRASRSITALSLPVGLLHVLQELRARPLAQVLERRDVPPFGGAPYREWSPTVKPAGANRCHPATVALFDGSKMPTVRNKSGDLPICDLNEWTGQVMSPPEPLRSNGVSA